MVAGVLTVLLGILGWHLSTCIAERKTTLLEFKKSSRATRIIEEKHIQLNTAFNMAQKHRADYLSQDSVQVKEIKRHFEQVVTESKNPSDGCHAYIEAAQDETAALHELSRYYPIPDVGADVDLNCQEPAKDAAIRAAYDSEEIERLAMDKSFRDEFVKSERLNNKSNLEADARLVQVLKEHEQLRTGLTQYAEGR